MDYDALDALTRPQIQKLCKRDGLKAIGKKHAMIRALQKKHMYADGVPPLSSTPVVAIPQETEVIATTKVTKLYEAAEVPIAGPSRINPAQSQRGMTVVGLTDPEPAVQPRRLTRAQTRAMALLPNTQAKTDRVTRSKARENKKSGVPETTFNQATQVNETRAARSTRRAVRPVTATFQSAKSRGKRPESPPPSMQEPRAVPSAIDIELDKLNVAHSGLRISDAFVISPVASTATSSSQVAKCSPFVGKLRPAWPSAAADVSTLQPGPMSAPNSATDNAPTPTRSNTHGSPKRPRADEFGLEPFPKRGKS